MMASHITDASKTSRKGVNSHHVSALFACIHSLQWTDLQKPISNRSQVHLDDIVVSWRSRHAKAILTGSPLRRNATGAAFSPYRNIAPSRAPCQPDAALIRTVRRLFDRFSCNARGRFLGVLQECCIRKEEKFSTEDLKNTAEN